MKEEDQGLRDEGIYALQRVGPDAKVAMPALVKLLGPSITAFKTKYQKEEWWKRPPRGVPVSSQPNLILRALVSISPNISAKYASISGVAPNHDAMVSEWQKAYETLKREYEKK